MRMTTRAYNRLRRVAERARGRRLPKAHPAHGPNETERAFQRGVLGGAGTFVGDDRRRHALTVTRLGSRYTPDFEYVVGSRGNCRAVYVEVKGRYRSRKDAELIERRSRLAWEIAAEKHPQFAFAWAKRVAGGWACEAYARRSGGEDATVGRLCRSRDDFDALLGEALGEPVTRI